MERIIIRHPNGETLPLYGRANVAKIQSGQQKKKLLGENIVEMTIRSATPIEFIIGDKITVFGEDYTLNLLPEAKKVSERQYEYSVTFESAQYDLAKVVFLDEDKSGLSTSTNFTLRANLEEIAGIIINNLARVYGEGKWELAKTPDQTTDVRDFSFAEDNCLAVLQKTCQDYDMEFKIEQEGTGDNAVYKLSITKIGNVIPYTLKYGHNRGLYSIKRKTIDSSNIVTRLYAFGGTKNIPADYRNYSTRLRFTDEGYIEDDEAIQAFGLIEGAQLFDDIYPKYTGQVTGIVEDDTLSFIDTALGFDLNEKDAEGNTKYLIDGVSAKITFNSGSLAGYTFEVSSYDAETHTFKILKYEDERGFVFPSVDTATFRIGVGDEYIITDIYPPQSYIDAAEEELRTAALEHLNNNKAPRVQYAVELAEEYLKKIAGDEGTVNIFDVGDYLGLVDTEIGVDRTGEASIRITDFSRDLTSVTSYKYNLEISDTLEVSIIERVISSQKELESIVVLNNLTDVSRLKRSWRTTQELLSMVFDPDGYFDTGNIRPLSIETSMLAVGAKSGQFTLRNTVIEPNYLGNANRVVVSGGQIIHYGLNVEELPAALKTLFADLESPIWNISDSDTTLTGSGAYYIYARCSKSTNTAEIIYSETQYTTEDGSYYYFLLGALHSVDTSTNTRWISLTYGSTAINGRFIKTGRISSSDGSCYFDLDNNTIHGRITFTSSDGSTKSLIDLETQSSSAYDYITNTLPGILSGIYDQLDGVIETWFGEVEPTLANSPASDWTTTTERDNHLGDLYYDTVSGYGYRFSKTGSTYSWTQLSDSGVAEALAAAAKAQDTADGKRRVFITTPYPPYDKGDLWTNGTDIRVCQTARLTGSYISSDWKLASDYTNNDELEAFIDGIFSDLVTQVDGKIENWYQAADPSTNWTTEDEQGKHQGDMWYNTSTKMLYRWTNSGTFKWVRIEDASAIAAAEAAAKAQDTADGKRTVFVSTPYTPYYVGDLWVNGTDIKYCNTERLTGSYVASDWGLASNYDHTKTVIDGGLITAGSIQLVGDNNVVQAGISGKGTDGSSIRIWAGATMDNRASAPFRVNQNGEVYARYRIELQDSNLNGLAGICGQGTDGTDTGIRFWAGTTYASRASAPFRVKKDGSLYCTKAELANGCKIGAWEVSNNGIFNDSGLAYMIARKSYGDGRYSESRIGTSVFPASTGVVGVGYFENTMLNTYMTNYGIMVKVSGAAYNIAMHATGDVVVNGLNVGYKLDTLTTKASTYHYLGYTGEVLVVTCKTDTSWLVFPDRYSVADHLGISTSSKFSVPYKVIISADSTKTCQLWGRTTSYDALNKVYLPYRMSADGGNYNSGHAMAKGDTICYQLVYDGSTYRAYLMTYSN